MKLFLKFDVDIGTPKGEKVDYAIIMNNQPVITKEKIMEEIPFYSHYFTLGSVDEIAKFCKY